MCPKSQKLPGRMKRTMLTANNQRSLPFRLLVGLAVAMVVLLLLEGGASLLPLDRWERDHPVASYPLFVPGGGDFSGKYVINPHFHDKSAEPQSFARVKEPETKRIFILGGSAAMGWPGTRETSFSGYMQRALDKVSPGKYEIVNIAARAYGSHRVLDFMSDVVRYEPDLIVVWSGNNEYLERNALTTYARNQSMRRLQRLLRQSGLYRLVHLTLVRYAPSWFVSKSGDDFTDIRKKRQIQQNMLMATERNPATDQQILANYRANLLSMAQLINESNAQGIFCTVPVNLVDWLPYGYTFPPVDSRFDNAVNAAVRFWQQGRFEESLQAWGELSAFVPEDPCIAFWRGRCHLRLGNLIQAKLELERARDLELRPQRALSSFQATIREVATEAQLSIADLEVVFVERSEGKFPGSNMFLDHVHPNETGHRLAAIELFSVMKKDFDPSLPLDRLSFAVAEDDSPPVRAARALHASYRQGCRSDTDGPNGGDEAKAKEHSLLASLNGDPVYEQIAGKLATIYEQRGDDRRALQYYQAAVQCNPGSLYAITFAKFLYARRNNAAAKQVAEDYGLRMDPLPILMVLGHIAYDEGHYEQALRYYRQLLDMGVVDPNLNEYIGDTYRQLGDEESARIFYRKD